MSNLYATVGAKNYDQLLSDPAGAKVISIPCTPGKGNVKRGTVMFREASGMYSPAAAENLVNTNMLVVLNEDVATGGVPGSSVTVTAEDAAAYIAGNFVDGRVTLKDGAALTAAHKVILRQQNITFTAKEGTETITNKVTG